MPCAGTAKKPSPEERRSSAEPRSAQSDARRTPAMCPQTRALSTALRRRAQRALCWHCKEAEPRGTTQQRRAKVGSKRRATHPGHVSAELRRRAQRALCWHCKEAESRGATQHRRARVGSKQCAPALSMATSCDCVPADMRVVRGAQERRTARRA